MHFNNTHMFPPRSFELRVMVTAPNQTMTNTSANWGPPSFSLSTEPLWSILWQGNCTRIAELHTKSCLAILFVSTGFCTLWLCILHSESWQSNAKNASTHHLSGIPTALAWYDVKNINWPGRQEAQILMLLLSLDIWTWANHLMSWDSSFRLWK